MYSIALASPLASGSGHATHTSRFQVLRGPCIVRCDTSITCLPRIQGGISPTCLLINPDRSHASAIGRGTVPAEFTNTHKSQNQYLVRKCNIVSKQAILPDKYQCNLAYIRLILSQRLSWQRSPQQFCTSTPMYTSCNLAHRHRL